MGMDFWILTKVYFQEQNLSSYESWTEYNKGHGRIEKREAFVCSDIDYLCKEHKWPGLRSVGIVRSTRTIKEKTTSEIRYYIMSESNISAEELCKTARSHWSIENQLHWQLDVLMGQDLSQIESDAALENMDILRKVSLALLQVSQCKIIKKPDSTRNMQRRVAQSSSFLRQVIELFFHA